MLSSLFASAQTKDAKLTGTYELLTVDNILADGSRVHLYGDNPQGLLIFDAQGHYTLQIYNQDRPKFAAADKSKGTDEENRAAVKGSNAHFGTYTIDEANGSIIFNIEHATFPNWEGAKQKRPFTLIGNVFKYTVPAPTTGVAVTGEVAWKKVE
ncbi:lipocalin-like domain-containing protein [Mucilaginibacter flavus]|uniref:lipocalin-like domain-containing protein n=1 Tax=Mucilaginibacter flavus TaxID=931504 RepID=UPI0025B398DB|nr:lipocalin-like domain-containing protein [Mucilaginibacter flavus]MDN3584052.1 lipocalin-like domain-containing protein [Mucilaginibacter flavus]